MKMRGTLVVFTALIGLVVCGPLAGSYGPLKISDNNIENIYNININIHGEFNLSLDQNIVQVIVALLNQEETSIGGAGQTFRDQLISLVQSIASTQKNQPEQAMNIDIPLGKNFNFIGISEKIREALQTTQL